MQTLKFFVKIYWNRELVVSILFVILTKDIDLDTIILCRAMYAGMHETPSEPFLASKH